MLWTIVSSVAAFTLVFAMLASLLGYSRTAIMAITLSVIATMTSALAAPSYAKGNNGNGGNKGGSQASAERGNSGQRGGGGSAKSGKAGSSKSTAAKSTSARGKGNGLLRALGLESPKATTQRTTRKAVVTKRKRKVVAKGKSRQKVAAQSQTAAVEASEATTIEPVGKGKHKKPGAFGAHPSALGALNAAHASEQALANANPNSRVGRIAAYRNAVLETETQREELADLTDILNGLEAPERPLEDVDADLELAQAELDLADALVMGLEADLVAAEGDPVLEEQIQADLDLARDAQMVAEDNVAALESELADGQVYFDTEQQIADLEDNLDQREDAELALLEAAANKPVTDPVVDEVRRLLGLPPVDRTEDEVDMSEGDEDMEEMEEVASQE